MKAIDAILDAMLTIVVLAAMLFFIPGIMHELPKKQTWGFENQDDKTMKTLYGDIASAGYITDNYSAAEVLLTTRISDYAALDVNDYLLPDGFVVRVDGDYKERMNLCTAQAQSALIPRLEYYFAFDYDNQIWTVNSA